MATAKVLWGEKHVVHREKQTRSGPVGSSSTHANPSDPVFFWGFVKRQLASSSRHHVSSTRSQLLNGNDQWLEVLFKGGWQDGGAVILSMQAYVSHPRCRNLLILLDCQSSNTVWWFFRSCSIQEIVWNRPGVVMFWTEVNFPVCEETASSPRDKKKKEKKESMTAKD